MIKDVAFLAPATATEKVPKITIVPANTYEGRKLENMSGLFITKASVPDDSFASPLDQKREWKLEYEITDIKHGER